MNSSLLPTLFPTNKGQKHKDVHYTETLENCINSCQIFFVAGWYPEIAEFFFSWISYPTQELNKSQKSSSQKCLLTVKKRKNFALLHCNVDIIIYSSFSRYKNSKSE